MKKIQTQLQQVFISHEIGGITPMVMCRGPEGQLFWLTDKTTARYIELYKRSFDETQKQIHDSLKKALAKEQEEQKIADL